MTFSDSRIAKMLKEDFVPVWESVAPVRVVTFDLGEGRSFTGTANGEIAIYFCTPEGKVFDILPALQSPAVTLAAMKEALAFYEKSKNLENEVGGKEIFKVDPFRAAVWETHRARLLRMAEESFQKRVRDGSPPMIRRTEDEILELGADKVFPKSKVGEMRREEYIGMAVDAATEDMRVMMMSKVASPGQMKRGRVVGDALTVVEPGGKGYFQWQIGKAFFGNKPRTYYEAMFKKNKKTPIYGGGFGGEPLLTPGEWKELLFEHILRQKLEGGSVKYDSDSLEAIDLIEE